MIHRIAMLALVSGAAMVSGAAQAQFYWGPFGPRPPVVDDDYFRRPPGRIPAPYGMIDETYNAGEIIGILREEGFRNISQPRRSGANYIATAIDRRGQRVRVVVDAVDGDIRAVTALAEPPARVARTPDAPVVTEPLPPPVAPTNPLNGQGTAPARPQAKPATPPKTAPSQAARPTIIEPKTPDRVILPNPATDNSTPPAAAAPAPQSVQPAPSPQIAVPAVPPTPVPDIPAAPPAIATPAVPPVSAPVIPAPAPSGSAAAETLQVPAPAQ